VDVCGIARLRGSNLKRYELLEEDICFHQPQTEMIYDEVILVSTFKFNYYILMYNYLRFGDKHLMVSVFLGLYTM